MPTTSASASSRSKFFTRHSLKFFSRSSPAWKRQKLSIVLMDTFAAPFMALVLTLPTIPSKFYLHALYRIGVAGESIQFQFCAHLMIHCRCAAFPIDLDGGGPPHSRELADTLKEAFSSSTLWDEWGMDVDIKV